MHPALIFKLLLVLDALHSAFFHNAAACGVFLEMPRFKIGVAHLEKRFDRGGKRLARIAPVPMLRADLTPALKARDKSP